jgi:hypothetical protein
MDKFVTKTKRRSSTELSDEEVETKKQKSNRFEVDSTINNIIISGKEEQDIESERLSTASYFDEKLTVTQVLSMVPDTSDKECQEFFSKITLEIVLENYRSVG